MPTKAATPRPLRSYTLTLCITVDTTRFAIPDAWDWGEMLDPNLSPGLAYTVGKVTEIPLNKAHEQNIADFDEEAK
jgi:hypothetical protein